MNVESAGKRNVTPEKAMELLKDNGVEISKKNAEEFLDLMYFLAKLSVDQYIKEVSNIEK